MTWPVTWAARSLARNVTTGATAAGGAAACARRSSGSRSVIRVSADGEMQFTVTPYLAIASAVERVRPALQVHADDRVPLLLGHVEDHALAQDAGAADDDLEVAEAAQRRVDDRLTAGHRRDALGVGHRLAAEGLDLLDHGLRRGARRLAAVHRHAVERRGAGRGQ